MTNVKVLIPEWAVSTPDPEDCHDVKQLRKMCTQVSAHMGGDFSMSYTKIGIVDVEGRVRDLYDIDIVFEGVDSPLEGSRGVFSIEDHVKFIRGWVDGELVVDRYTPKFVEAVREYDHKRGVKRMEFLPEHAHGRVKGVGVA